MNPMTDQTAAPLAPPLAELIDRLFAAYGPQHWWPGDSAYEMMVGAILVQHTAWRNVEHAIAALGGAGVLSFDRLASIDVGALAELVRPAGPPRVKAERLHALAKFVIDEADGSTDRLFEGCDDREGALGLRRRLLGVRGVGPETADAILLYAGGAPVFVIDAYTRRVLARHGWASPRASYDALQGAFEGALPRDPALFNEAHALLVKVAVEHCRSPRPRCEGCPLAPLLPASGPCAC
ncbi:MAG: endonuclease III domain-containing protein [Lacipirellulaceae bacterium]